MGVVAYNPISDWWKRNRGFVPGVWRKGRSMEGDTERSETACYVNFLCGSWSGWGQEEHVLYSVFDLKNTLNCWLLIVPAVDFGWLDQMTRGRWDEAYGPPVVRLVDWSSAKYSAEVMLLNAYDGGYYQICLFVYI